MSDALITAALPKRPATTDDLVAAIRAAAESNTQLRLTGSNSLPLTRFDPARPVQEISTLRLNKVLDHAIADMTITVQAGISLDALQRHLAWHNQWLPVDPPIIAAQPGRQPNQRTLGGLIATNSLGPLRFSNAGGADWRLFIMGMKWIDASGTLIKGGGRTMKNVAGYSTPRLMIGSCGSLGAIAEVTLRTFARPQDEQCVIFFCTSASQAEELLADILTSATTPAYLQAVGGRTFTDNPLQLPSPKKGMAIVAGFLDRPQSCVAQIDTLRALPAARGIESISQTAAQSGRLRLWMTTEPSLETLGTAQGLGVRVHALSSEICPLIAALESATKSAGGKSWLVSEAAAGVLRAAIAAPNAAGILREAIAAHAPQARTFITQGNAAPAADNSSSLAARLKAELDPHSTFGHPRESL
ncbi:MAG TPA: FAD-binding oxidoreductase [Phycisphaerae bacterium]|nr:FAD-binding oxidoreductase [Phycisphaerae bacterium]